MDFQKSTSYLLLVPEWTFRNPQVSSFIEEHIERLRSKEKGVKVIYLLLLVPERTLRNPRISYEEHIERLKSKEKL